jgi:hypothetical protein
MHKESKYLLQIELSFIFRFPFNYNRGSKMGMGIMNRKVAIALGIICIVLLVNVIANDRAILQNQVNSLNNELATFRNQVNELTAIVNLQKSTILVDHQTVSQPVGYYTCWTFKVDYAGYIEVWVHTSTTDTTYVQVVWSSYGINYDNKIIVGASGKAFFPVLPCSHVEVRVGHSNLFSGATETVTIIYHY